MRWTRLPFVASLFLAMLLGVPAVVAVPTAAPPLVSITAAERAAERAAQQTVAAPTNAEPAEPLHAFTPAATADVLPAAPARRDRAVRAALAPRAPPRR